MIRHSPCVTTTCGMFNEKLMSVSIKILKDNLNNHPESASKLNLYCKKDREEINACVPSRTWSFDDFFNLLSELKIH
jgi:hypothetical protein